MGKYLPAIDGLRAFAVLSVVAYHAGLPLGAGFVGVDVFFVISGYVITRMLWAEPEIDLVAFYARRVRRILPALIVVVAATLALSAVFSPADVQIATSHLATWSMAMLPNVWLHSHTGGYFDLAADKMPLLHLWSLGVEEQFYLVWPLLLAMRKRWVLVSLAVLSFASTFLIEPAASFYMMPPRFWELAVGGLLALMPARSHGRLAAIAGGVLLCAAVALPSPVFPGIGALPAVAGAWLVLYAVHAGERIAPLELRAVRYVGAISYGLYLWHWPLLAMAPDASPWMKLALCALAFALAALSHRFIEMPIRRNAPRARTIAIGVFACVVLAGCSAAVEPALRKVGSLQTRAALDGPADLACSGLAPRCEADVVVWGDSHAKAWLPFAERYGVVHQLTHDACLPSAIVDRPNGCARFNAQALPILRRAPIVVMGGYWMDLLPRERWRADFRSALGALHGQRVVVIGPIPIMAMRPQECLQAGDPALCTMTRAEFERRAAPIRAFMRAEIAKHPGAEYIEPVDFFCNASACPLVRGDYALFWDEDHITRTAAREFAKAVDAREAIVAE